MEFPDVDRVVFENNPLTEVVCEFRFSEILALVDAVPAEFQRVLGGNYPYAENVTTMEFTFVGRGQPTHSPAKLQYVFSTEDRDYKVALSSVSLAISTTKYVSWSEFFPHVKVALEALERVYSLPIVQRVGLRYIDAISRKKLNLEETRWSNLIRNSALGLLAENDVPISDVEELNSATALKLDGGGSVVLRTGLGKTDPTGGELVFVVDSDFFQEGPIKETRHAFEICERFNRTAGRAFQWFILPELRAALGPNRP